MDFTNGTRERQGALPAARPTTPPARSVLEWVRVLRDGLPAVILFLVLGLGAGAAYTALQPREYQSVATLVAGSSKGFLEPESSSGLAPVTSTVTRLAGSAAVIEGTQQEYIASSTDRSTIRARRREATLGWVRDHLTARQVADSGIVELAGTAGNQEDARALTQSAASSLRKAIEETPGTSVGTDTTRARGVAIRDFQTADEGVVSPTPVRNLVLGGNVGLLLGIVAGLGLGARRRRLRRPDEMAAELGIPILATVRSGDTRDGVPRALGAARARLQRLSEPDHGTVFLLTGTARAERAAELGEALARVFAASSRTLLVDADLSQQHASRHLDVDGLPGLGELLNGRGPQQLLRPEQVLVTTVNGSGPDTEIEMLPAGERPTDVAAALSGSALARSIQNLRLRYEFVILVGPGFDRPEEVIPLSSVCDWTVLVTPRGERASTFEATNALALTDALAGRVAGAIIVDRR
jgi:capsular polysaccharide biosynthesis protein